MYKVNDVANWLSQTTDNSKYFVWSPGLWDKESRLYFDIILNIYIAPGQGQTSPWGQNFDVNRKAICCKFEVWFYIYFLMFSCMYIAPGQEQTTPWWQSFDINRKPRSLWSSVAKFWCQQKALTTLIICCKFQKNLFEFWFYTLFNVFPHVYSPGAGADNPLWTNFWCHQKGLVTLPICCKFQKNTFEVWFYTYFCLFLYMYIALGQEQTTPWGQNFYFNINLLSLWLFAVSFFH